MDPKVSIIVGLYNVSPYLKEKHLNCILQQTYPNWELILVDDGSTDETPRLCDLFAEKDSRIKVFHKKNGGLGSARNLGMKQATGEYLWFYDVDDEVELNLLECCVSEMEQRQVDLMIFGFWAITPSQNLTEEVHFTEREIRGQKQLRDSYLDNLLFVRYGNGFAWNKVYRRSFIEQHHLKYENQRIQQDEVFNLKVYQAVDSIYISSKLFYHYFIYNTGNSRSRFIPNRFDIYLSIFDHFIELKNAWQINDPRFIGYLYKRLYSSVSQCLLFNLFHPDCPWSREEKKNEIERIMSDNRVLQAFSYLKRTKLGIEQRLYLNAFKSKSLFLISLYKNLFSFMRKLNLLVDALSISYQRIGGKRKPIK